MSATSTVMAHVMSLTGSASSRTGGGRTALCSDIWKENLTDRLLNKKYKEHNAR